MSAQGEATAPDHEALLTTVETAGAALVAALEACVAAGLPVGSIEDVQRAARTDGTRAWLAEQARPKGPMATITVPGRHGAADRTYQAEVEKITDASIIVRGGGTYALDTGRRRKQERWGATPRIAMDEVARIVATGWTPPKAAKKARAK